MEWKSMGAITMMPPPPGFELQDSGPSVPNTQPAQQQSRPITQDESALNYLFQAAGKAVPYAIKGMQNGIAFINGTVDAKEYPALADASQMFQKTGPGMALNQMSQIGRFANQGNQMLANQISSIPPQPGLGRALTLSGNDLMGQAVSNPQGVGKAYGAMSNFLMPQNNVQSALALGGGMAQEASAARQGASEAAALQRAQGQAPVLQPGPVGKVGAQVLTASTAMQPGKAKAIMADSSILSDITVPKAQVSKMYDEFYKSQNYDLGAEMNSIMKSNFPPRDTQVAKLQSVIDDTLDALKANPKDVKPEQLLVANQAAGKLAQSTNLMGDKGFVAALSKAQSTISGALNETGNSKVLELDRMYFRASAKEAAESILPQNRNMSPNALRSVVLLNQFANAGQHLSAGEPVKAMWSAGKGLAMSPYVATRALAAGSSQASPLAQALGVNAIGKIQSLDNQ